MFTFFDRITPAQILREADKGGGGGGGGATTKVDWPDEVVQGFKNLISKEGGEKDAAMKLFEENYEHRKRIRELEGKLEGSNSLSDEEYEQFKAYQELGEDPEKLKERLENAEESQQELSKLKREKSNRDVAEVQGWNPKVLDRLADEDAEFEIKTRKNDDDEDEKYAVIKTEDGEKDLSEYAKENWEDVLPALKASGQSDEGDESKNKKKFSKQKSSSEGKSNEGGYLDKWKKGNKKAAGVDSDDDE